MSERPSGRNGAAADDERSTFVRLHKRSLDNATAALALVLEFRFPADSVLSRYFRERPMLGQADRAFIAESVFGVLRHKRVLDALTCDAPPRRLLLAWLARFATAPREDIARAVTAREREWLSAIADASTEMLPAAVRAELPDWVWEKLASSFSESERLALGAALQAPAPLDLRVNTVRSNRERVLAALRESGIEVQPTPYSPYGVRIMGRPALNRHPLFAQGHVEVQDEGSQLVTLLAAPRRRDLVVDFCAGAGGKTLMLGALMHSQGRLYAFDVSAARLERMKPRLKRSGLSNIHPYHLSSEHDIKVKRLAGKIDRVLVDAPCSGFGTLRRNPDLKWRISRESMAEMRERQAAILRAAATLLKPGGRLVYATCSVLAEENEEIVDAFANERDDFQRISCAGVLRAHAVALDTGDYLKLSPHIHETDGFFGAILERKATAGE